MFPAKSKNSESCITPCKKCVFCKNYQITDNKFNCKVTGRFYNVRGNLSCNNSNVIDLISCRNCEDQCIGSVIDLKIRSGIHKSYIKTKKGRCGTARHFDTKCSDVQNPKQVSSSSINLVSSKWLRSENKLWEREKYWKCQLFSHTHGINNVFNWYPSKWKVCRKKWWYIVSNVIFGCPVPLLLYAGYHNCFTLPGTAY